MRARSVSWVLLLFACVVSTSSVVANEFTIQDQAAVCNDRREAFNRQSEQTTPPTPPLPWARASILSPMTTSEMHAVTALDAPGSPDDSTVVIPLSAGLSIVSLPVRAPSEKLSDLFPNLPAGSRVWIWDATNQSFVEGSDNKLALGRACWLYVPVPVMLLVSGRPNLLQQVSVDLEKGWNLVGVPYDSPLLRSQQHVYVDWARTELNDAVASGKVGSAIYAFDVNGYENVHENGSFQPLRGYWVYASGAELLELGAPGLGDGVAFSWMSVLSPLADFAKSSILTQLGYSDTAKLNQITDKLDKLQTSLNGLSAKLDTVLNAIGVVESNILQEIGHQTLVAPVQVALASHYDQENAGSSLAWFVKQAKAGQGTSVSMQVKSEFARQVLTDWAFIDKFNSINAAILPTTGDAGIIDNFANRVVLTSDEYALTDHYVAMETYYSTLVAMQVKCATLILSAYDQLGSDPAWSAQYPAPQTATDWKKNVFDPTIKAETQAFLRAAENVAVRKLPAPTTASDPRVKTPDSVQVVMGLADAYVMGMLQPIDPDLEPAGIRVRVLVNASADHPWLVWMADTGSVFDVLHARGYALPSFDQWRVVQGDVEYDDWILDPALKPSPFRDMNVPAFNVTKAWRLTRVILPTTSPIYVGPAGESNFWRPLNVQRVASTGSFGSITLAARPSTREIFDPCRSDIGGGNFSSVHYSGECGAVSGSGLNPCDTLNLDSCTFQPSSVTLKYVFGYAGTVMEAGAGAVPRNGTWKADGTYSRTNTHCRTDFSYELWEGDSKKDRTFDSTPPPITAQNYSFTWQPGKVYTFNVSLIGDPMNSAPYFVPACDGSWKYKGANITFP